MKLLVPYYKSDSPKRQSELDYCLRQNLTNEHFDKIVVFFNDEVWKMASVYSSEMEVVKIKDRLTYERVFSWASTFASNDLCVMANSDIIFDDSIKMAEQVKENELVVVTRVELDQYSFKTNLPHSYIQDGFKVSIGPEISHDAWIFRTPLPTFASNFQLGQLHCDGNLVREAKRAGVDVSNGYKHIKAMHVHWSEFRTYDRYGYDVNNCGKVHRLWSP